MKRSSIFSQQQHTTFREGVLGYFKGIFWPAFLVHELLEFLDKE